MFAWQATVQDNAGNAIVFPVVTVYENDGVTLASIFEDDEVTPLDNPLTGSVEGFVQFWADAGRYKVVGANGPSETAEWNVNIDAPAIRAEEAAARVVAFTETDAEMALLDVPAGVDVITRIPDGYSVGQVAADGIMSMWRVVDVTGVNPYFTTLDGRKWIEATQPIEDYVSILSSVVGAIAGDPAVAGIGLYNSRAEFLAADISGTVQRSGYIDGRRSIVFIRDVAGTAATTADGGNWSPDGEIFAKHFGAAEDYNDTADIGTDDLTALNNATAYAATLGKYVWVDDASYVSGPVQPPLGCRGFKATRPVGSSTSQVGAPAWPSGYKLGSAIIGGHLSGPVVHLRYSDQWCDDMELGATAARRAATISTGAGNINCGLLIEPPDTSGQSLSRSGANRCLFRNQPADGWFISGSMTSVDMINNSEINCGRHGFVIDNGTTAGRTYLGKPGIITVRGDRQVNLGGHEYKIGHESADVDQPYRVTIDRAEGFRAGNNPSMLVDDAAVYILGEQVTVLNTAASATSGLSGSTPTLAHAYAIGGRSNSVNGSRGIGYTEEPILILQSPWESSPDGSSLIVTGEHNANEAAPDPVNLIKHDGQIIDLYVDNVSGNFSGYPIDLAGFLGSAIIDYDGVLTHINKQLVADKLSSKRTVLIKGSNLVIASGAVTVTGSYHQIDTEAAAATDDLDTINGGVIGQRLVLQTLASARDIVIKATGGNIRLSADVTLNNSFDKIELFYDGTYWTAISAFGNNGA